MLRSLYIKNFALIDDITVEFGPGLNILTGETGAGKSILLDALQVALGGRASAEYIRAGEEKAVIQAAFEVETESLLSRLEDLGIAPPEDGVLVLSREITRNGRNLCRVNGQMIALTMYRQAGGGLADLHSQHQQQSLLDTERHLDLLDSYGGLVGQREKVNQFYHQWHRLQNKLEQLQTNARETARQMEMLTFQLKEIEVANLSPDEDELLVNERNLLVNAEKISTLANLINQALYNGGGKYQAAAVELIGEALNSVRELSQYDPKVESHLESLESAMYAIEDVAREMSGYLDNVDFDPQRLDYIERRIDEINRLKRKYGETVSDILSYYNNIATQLNELSNSEEQYEQLQTQADEYRKLYQQEADKLSQLRQHAARKLQGDVAAELAQLEMEKVKFKIAFLPLDKPSAKGNDDVEFLIAPNPGEPLKPLHKTASGGELSRFMLAIKTLLAEVDAVGTLVFDEVDTGIGGRALQSVGEKMAQIGKSRQVITVTHAPQVACFAKNHYLIKKEVTNNRTFTKITKLDYDGRLHELARMLGGKDTSNVVMTHAEELLKLSS
ncbi:DNA repair protein RecN [Peptococcaceae bacterium 1198_IL3148]